MIYPDNNKTKIVFHLATEKAVQTRTAFDIVQLAFHYMDDDKSTKTVESDFADKTVTLYVDFTVFDEQVRFRDLTEVLSSLGLLAKPEPEVEED